MDEKVFISYSRKDTDWADRIKAALESNGISCWMDRAGIKAGEKYTREIINAIKRCDVFLLVLSPNAEQSEWVPKELGKAIQYHKYIIPVKITDFEVEEFELQLENIQIFELDSLSEIQSQINLVNTVKDVLRLKPADHQPCAQISDEPSPGSAKKQVPIPRGVFCRPEKELSHRRPACGCAGCGDTVRVVFIGKKEPGHIRRPGESNHGIRRKRGIEFR